MRPDAIKDLCGRLDILIFTADRNWQRSVKITREERDVIVAAIRDAYPKSTAGYLPGSDSSTGKVTPETKP